MNISKTHIRYILVIFLVFISFPFVFFRLPETGLDPSWKIAIHLAIKNNLLFGKDFIFTYGPLGILYTRLPISVPRIVYLLFDIFFLFNFLFILNQVLKKEPRIFTGIFLFLVLCITMHESAEQWYFFFFLFYLFSFILNPEKLFYAIFAAILAIICFYIKLSLGSITIIIFLGSVLYTSLRQGVKWSQGLLLLIAFATALYISAYFLHVELVGYIRNSLEIINAYNDSMFITGDPAYTIFIFAAIVILSFFVVLVFYKLLQSIQRKDFLSKADAFVLYGITSLYLFVLFKNGFVRVDGGHTYGFYRGIAFSSLLLLFFLWSSKKDYILLAYCAGVIVLSFWAINTMPESNHPYKNLITGKLLSIKLTEVKNYVRDFQAYSVTDPGLTAKDEYLRNIVGDKTFDVIPTEASLAYFNHLKYNPRPVIQTYSAYNGFLDSLNSQKLQSSNSADFILFSLGSIDNRYAFFDESRTKLALLGNYAIHSTVDDQLLLIKTKSQRQIGALGKVIIGKLGEDIEIPKTKFLLFSNVQIHYTIWGKLKRLFFKPPELTMTFTLASGEKFTYKAITTILSGGVILNKFIDTNEEFALLMYGKGVLNNSIVKVRFDTQAKNAFQGKVKITTSHVSIGDNPLSSMNHADSVNVLMLFNKFKAQSFSSDLQSIDSSRIWIDPINTHSQFIKITGWAFLEGKSNDSTYSTIVLKSGKLTYELPTSNYNRSDLLEFYGRNDITRAALSATLAKSTLPAGNYQIGIHFVNKNMNIDALNFTDQSLTIKLAPQL